MIPILVPEYRPDTVVYYGSELMRLIYLTINSKVYS
jgi:hypothetical protein